MVEVIVYLRDMDQWHELTNFGEVTYVAKHLDCVCMDITRTNLLILIGLENVLSIR